jgi:hypothetical protein
MDLENQLSMNEIKDSAQQGGNNLGFFCHPDSH